ncbi:allene oxide cyclase barrel-like domain-containing protein [Streptomyces sp. HD]|uniref:allene oxide cyclase barrel-like domain-containing protein n=1 Tax=Streptomyces sp. HD TaxID=3020892 RepID=UPI00232C98BD|nr:hypothetical protein [Streptomyces sp. HD]MDC0773026.1 hypothetical protein [Streptomyces sp. HD]
MLPHLRTFGVLGACLTAAVALGAPLPASAAPTQDDETFTLYAREVVDPNGESESEPQEPDIGDSFAFADDLYRAKGGETVGRDGVTCTVVRLGNPGDLLCVGTFVLPGGHISGQALLPLQESEQQPTFDIAITGGTGDYEAARGSIHSTDDGDYQKLEFRVQTA